MKNTILNEFGQSDLFAIKDPRLVYSFPLYERALKDLNINMKVVIPYRHPYEVAKSLQNRNEFSINQGYMLWANHIYWAVEHTKNTSRTFVSYCSLLNDTKKTILDFLKFFGLENILQKNFETINNFLKKVA